MLFDTSIVIDVLKNTRKYERGSISSITLLEIIRGTRDAEMSEVLELLRQMYRVYDLDDDVIRVYSKLYQGLESSKRKFKEHDLIIAATAYAKSEKLITSDNDFKVLKDLLDIGIG